MTRTPIRIALFVFAVFAFMLMAVAGFGQQSQILASMRNRCNEGIRLSRRLDEKTAVINVVPAFDAIEAGTHSIYSVQEDGAEHLDATAQFTHLWTKKAGPWQLLRVVSFDHH
jgi:hypothetical protein